MRDTTAVMACCSRVNPILQAVTCFVERKLLNMNVGGAAQARSSGLMCELSGLCVDVQACVHRGNCSMIELFNRLWEADRVGSMGNHEWSFLGGVCRRMVVLCYCYFHSRATSCGSLGRVYSCISYARLEGSE